MTTLSFLAVTQRIVNYHFRHRVMPETALPLANWVRFPQFLKENITPGLRVAHHRRSIGSAAIYFYASEPPRKITGHRKMSDTQLGTPRSLALIHTVPGLIGPFDTLSRQHLPGWSPFAMLDESLLRTTIREGKLSLTTMRRLTSMVWSAVDASAEAVIVTCSSLGPAVEAARPICPVPLFRIDQGMAREAVRRGPRIGVLATLSTTLDPTTDLIRRTAEAMEQSCTLTSRLADGAFARLSAGDTQGHDRLVAESLTDLAPDVDVIVLAQASMARALETVKDRIGPLPVLTSPELGLAHIAAILAG